MKKIGLIFVLFFTVCVVSYAQNDVSWREANDLYAKGEYGGSIEKYKQILDNGFESENLYFNLGNAYFKSDSIAKAIINYRRALKLAPANEDILYNIDVAKARTVNQITEVPTLMVGKWIDSLNRMFSSNNWAIIGIITFAVMLLFVAGYLLSNTPGKRKFTFTMSNISLVIFILSITNSVTLKDEYVDSNEAVVVSSAASVKSSPDKNGKDLFILNEGAEVKTLDNVNGYIEIVIASGSKGWIDCSAIEVI